MATRGTYYLGRLIKYGVLDKEKVFEALTNPIPVHKTKHSWTITDAETHKFGSHECIIGKLNKFRPDGEVKVVAEDRKSQQVKVEPDMVIATSTFIYIPAFSGIAFLHVWNQIEQSTFMNRFCEIIKESHQNFFVDCEIELITNINTFSQKISQLKSINKIVAKVHPPNPLFGRFWKPLKEYLERRNTSSLQISEENTEAGKEVKTNLKNVTSNLANNEPELEITLDLGDAAILMAADGYGRARIEGKNSKGHIVVVKTSENVVSFKLEKEPLPTKIYETVAGLLDHVSQERYMEH
jgi:hypothetical protein